MTLWALSALPRNLWPQWAARPLCFARCKSIGLILRSPFGANDSPQGFAF